jgi:peptidoglycan/xylan/chitin deacetylase (PgdA/CDA1 family)
MRKVLLTLFLLAAVNFVYPQFDKSVCITCDDLPYVTKYSKDKNIGHYITDRLLESFNNYYVTAIGSVNAGRLFQNGELDTSKLSILNKWLEAGMTFANHTYSHKNYNNVYFGEFKYDILDGEIYIKDFLESKGRHLKYFRHPYLFRGDTKEKADLLQSFLDSLGYVVAPVTIDNSDYIFSWAYEKAKSNGNDTLAERIGNDYVNYMEEVLKYYDNFSLVFLGYNIRQILLMHANLLNADYFGDVLKMYVKNGYRFATLDETLTDSCYNLKDEFYKKSGISWLHRWAYTAGKRGDFFKGEPDVPEYINEYIKE